MRRPPFLVMCCSANSNPSFRVPPNSTVANWPPAFNRNQFLVVHRIVPPFRDKMVLPNPKLAFRTPRGCHAARWCTIAALSLSRVRIGVRVTPQRRSASDAVGKGLKF